jgi:hypothetical protein
VESSFEFRRPDFVLFVGFISFHVLLAMLTLITISEAELSGDLMNSASQPYHASCATKGLNNIVSSRDTGLNRLASFPFPRT